MNMRLAAVKDFQTQVALAYPSQSTTKSSTGESSTSHAQGIEARLLTVEDLRKRGLISAAEAEEKRREILKGL